jgi:hypothetical protein
MAWSVLDDKSRVPDDGMLADVLGKSKGFWDAILAHLAEEYPGVQNEWGFPGAKYGWSLRPKHKKRTILYLTPGKGCFLVSFALGERAVAAAEESTLPESVLDAIRSARQYAEGRGVRIEVKCRTDVETVKKLVEIKMTH